MIPGLLPVPSRVDIQTALRSVLLQILPDGVEVIAGQDNNVPEPTGDFVSMTVLRQERLATNIVAYEDCAFTGAIAGRILTPTNIRFGSLTAGRLVFGTGAATAPTISAVNSDGTATLSQNLTVTARPMASGVKGLKQKTRFVFQLDIHCDDDDHASDMGQVISTMLRDDAGIRLFAATNVAVTPLYADDPRQMPFVNAEQQYEDRFVVECHLQADQIITPPQEFMDRVDADRIPADIFFAA